MNDGFELDDIQAAEESLEHLHHDEREALQRVAKGLGGLPEAVLLAGSLHHFDLFTEKK